MRKEQNYVIPEQAADKYRYYITNDALNHGTMPHMEGMRVSETIHLHKYEQGAVSAFGFLEYPRPLTAAEEKEYHLTPSSDNANYLQTAEMSIEQNLNHVDGIINNEPPRSNHGNVIPESEARPSIRIQLKKNATDCEKQNPVLIPKKDMQER